MDNPVNKAPETPRKPVLAVPGPISTTTAPAPESAPVPVSAPVVESPVSPVISPSQKSEAERLDPAGRPIADTITDKNFGEFHILKTANGWWGDLGKVQSLIDAYKIRSTDEMACSYAGISIDQLRYFNEQHPDFSRVKAACKELLKLAAMNKLAAAINAEGKPGELPHLDKVFWFLERVMREEFSTRTEVVDPRAEEMKKASEDLKQLIEDVSKLTNDQVGPEAVGTGGEEAEGPGDKGGASVPEGAGATDTPGAPDARPEAAPTVAASSPA